MAYRETLEEILKKKRRDWFLTAWRPQGKCYGCKNRGAGCDKCELGGKYRGSACYDDVRVQCEAFACDHSGAKWAYSIHEKGHLIEDWPHENCEHKHIVLHCENPCSGSSVQKYFKGCYIEPARYTVGHCARYLLHLTVSSLQKERISASDLYCSGKGEHGDIWFEITSPVIYDTFNKDNVLHYVYNDHLTSLFKFISRFGSTCASGVNYQTIHAVLSIYDSHQLEYDYIKEIFELLPRDKQQFIGRQFCGMNAEQSEVMTFEDLRNDRFFEQSRIPMDFMRLYIWLHNYSGPASDELLQIMKDYGFSELLRINTEREELMNIIQTNSVFGESLVSSAVAGESDDGGTPANVE